MNTKIALIAILSFTAAASTGCDSEDDREFSREKVVDVGGAVQLAPGSKLSVIPLDAPEELELEIDESEEANWSEFDLSESIHPAAGPAGKTCCVNCGDGWSGWWDLGKADGCNARGASFCHAHSWSFINAEWC
jgi:hypothetical protein